MKKCTDVHCRIYACVEWIFKLKSTKFFFECFTIMSTLPKMSKERWIVSMFPSFVEHEEKYITDEIEQIQILNQQREIYLILPQAMQNKIQECIEWAETWNPTYGHCPRDPHYTPSVGDLLINNISSCYEIFTIKFKPKVTIHYNRYGTALIKVNTTIPAIKAMSDKGIKFDAFAISKVTDNGKKYVLMVHDTNELLRICNHKTKDLCFGFIRMFEEERKYIVIPMAIKMMIVKRLNVDLEKLQKEWKQ